MKSPDEERPPPEQPRLSLLAQVSNEMVRLYKEQFGRGPTRARSHWCDEDVLVCVLEETLTAPERAMVRMGEHQRLREMRIFLQYTSEAAFCEPIERLTGRTVAGFISGIDVKANGLSIETFVFEPR
jgi:uncharacterized protein YbcI